MMGGAQSKKEKEDWCINQLLEVLGDQKMFKYEIQSSLKNKNLFFSNKSSYYFEKLIAKAIKINKIEKIENSFLPSYCVRGILK